MYCGSTDCNLFSPSQIEHLKACSEVASSRTINWQRFCNKDDSVLPFLVQTSIALDEGVAPVILQLLQCALCGSKPSSKEGKEKEGKGKKEKESKEKSDEKEKEKEGREMAYHFLVLQPIS